MRVSVGVANVTGRVDAFAIESSAFHIKHSAKRLSPWRFTFLPDHLEELEHLAREFNPVWIFLVCGVDGVVGISLNELKSILEIGDGGAGWIRASRNRSAMYRVGGGLGDLEYAKPMGVAPFLAAALRAST